MDDEPEVCSKGGADGCQMPVHADGLCSKHLLAQVKRAEKGISKARYSPAELERHWRLRDALEERLRDVLAERRIGLTLEEHRAAWQAGCREAQAALERGAGSTSSRPRPRGGRSPAASPARSGRPCGGTREVPRGQTDPGNL